MANATKRLTHGEGLALMILVGQAMGVSVSMVEMAADYLKGNAPHVMHMAALEREAGKVNDALSHDAALIDQANGLAKTMAAEFGYS